MPRVVHKATGQAFHESARLGMLASPTGSEMAVRQRRFLDRVEAGGLLDEVVSSLMRDAQKAGQKANADAPSSKEPVPVK